MSKRAEGSAVFFFAASQQYVTQTCWRPLADVYRTADGWLVKFELPGVRPEDVTVLIQSCRLKVSGVRRDWVLEQGCVYQSLELPYGRFERSVELPCELNPTLFQMEFVDGLLVVRLGTEGDKR